MRAMTSMLLAGALALGVTMASANEGGRGEFGDQCAYGLSVGKKIMTDCSINFTGDRGVKYCFSSQKAAISFMSDFDKNMEKAKKNYSRM